MKKRIVANLMLVVMLIVLLPVNEVQAATYQKNSRGTQVLVLQQNLTFLGFSTGTADGVFGNNTRNAVVELQNALNLEQTGKVDEELNKLIKGTVADIQRYMKEKGYYTGVVDGECGNLTKNSLKKLQKSKGYPQTGIANYAILREIVNDTDVKAEMDSLLYWVLRLGNKECEYKDEKYLSLFREYPVCLNNTTFNTVLNNYIANADTVISMNEDGTVFGAILTGLSEGKDIIWNELVSLWSDNTKSYKEQMRLDAISCLMGDICKKDGLITIIADEVGSKVESLRSGYNLKDAMDKEALCQDLLGIYPALSVEEIEEILTLISEDDTLEEKFKGVNLGIDLAEYAVGAIQLYQIEISTLERLQSLLPKDCDMYHDLEYLKKERNRDEEAYIREYFLSPYVRDLLIDALEDNLLPFPANVVMAATEVGIDIFANHIYTGALSEELIQTCLLKSYVNTLRSTILDMGTKYSVAVTQQGKLPTLEEIENYEFVYSAYLVAVKNYLISAEKIADSGYKSLLNSALKEYDQWMNYDNYITLCLKELEKYSKKTVTEKMDYLLEKLGVEDGKNVYFTVNQKACGTSRLPKHGCTNCNMSDIVKANWFTDLFGKINVNNFPSHDVDANRRDYSGQACFGFACFAQWYLYADSASENLKGERVAAVPFNKINMEKHVQPGDVVRVNGHSVLVYSLQEDGLMVIDSNWNISGQLNCLVQKHLLAYDNGNYANYTAYINRVTKTKTMEEGRAGVFDVSTNITGAPISTPVPTVTATPKPTCTPVPTAVPTQKPTATSAPTSEPTTTGWVKASECPAGVEIVETKWTYTYTDRTESEAAELAGWIREGERKEVVVSGSFDYAAFPDTFDTSHPVYTGMFTSKEAVPSTNGAVREIISDVPAGYVYWHYSYPMGDGSVGNRIVGYYYNQNLKYVGSWCYATEFSAFKSPVNYDKEKVTDNKEGGGKVYKITDAAYITYDIAKGSYWWYRFAYNTCTFQDVKTVYQYYRTINKESTTEVYEGNGNSNVVKWVRYK